MIHYSLYPVAIVEDRYGGSYSDGAWLAIAKYDRAYEGGSRLGFIEYSGANDGDIEAADFWYSVGHEIPWLAVGNSPDDALQNLIARCSGYPGKRCE